MTRKKKTSTAKRAATKPKLLTGGNPQIPKGDGDASVQAYINAMPDWKSKIGRQLDKLIVETVPNVRKAVRWNTPFYGIEGQGWFMAFGCTTKYVKVTFFAGKLLAPVPPIESKQETVRYFHIFKESEVDELTITHWIRQASELPGEAVF